MSTEFFNDQWRIPSNENQNKISNYSMDFNGSSDKIEVQDSSNEFGFSSNKFSLSAWIRIDSNASQNGVIAKRNLGSSSNNKMWYFEINTSSQLRFLWYDTLGGSANASSTDTIPLNTWTHIVVTSDGSGTNGLNFYINGTPDSGGSKTSPSSSSSIQQTGTPLWIGARGGNSAAQYTNGKIDQVTIFDYELSPIQVASLGLDGYAFNFIPNDYIDLGTTTAYDTGDLSAAIWVNASSSRTGTIYPFSNSGSPAIAGFDFVIYTNNEIRIRRSTTTKSNTTNQINIGFVSDTWQHLALTYSESTNTLKLFLNGVLKDTVIGTDQTNIASKKLTIGSYKGASAFFDGELSNAQVLNSKLEDSEITTLYNNGKPLPDMSSFTSLQGWWKLDDTATFNSSTSVWTIPDDSSNSNNGTSVGMNASNLVASNINGELIANPMATSPKPIAYYQLGDQSAYNGSNYLVPNNSLSSYAFSFANDVIIIANGSTIARQQNISYSLWVNAGNISSTRYIVGNNGSSNKGTSIFILNDVLVFQIGNDSNSSYYNSRVSNLSNYVNSNEWFHVAASWDGTDSKIYINGVERNNWTPSQPYTITGWSNNFVIGRRADTGASGFYGKLSNVAFWDSGLTPTQVQTIYNNGTPNDISSLNPVGWWKLNQQDVFVSPNWTINDYGSGGNDGTSSGMTSANLVVSDLQQTSGYSPYALNFDGLNDYLNCGYFPTLSGSTSVTVSLWYNKTRVANEILFDFLEVPAGSGGRIGMQITANGSYVYINAARYNHPTTASIGNWANFVLVFNGAGATDEDKLKIYLDGIELIGGTYVGTVDNAVGTFTSSSMSSIIGMLATLNTARYKGKLSNVAVWNTNLSSTEVTEIYNEGVPSNLHNFSGTAPVSWWQLGSNSSFNTKWTCLDEIGTNNAVSFGDMTNSDIVNGPGYSATGLGTSSIDIKGNAPYSSGNGLSENMDVLDRVKDTPPT